MLEKHNIMEEKEKKKESMRKRKMSEIVERQGESYDSEDLNSEDYD